MRQGLRRTLVLSRHCEARSNLLNKLICIQTFNGVFLKQLNINQQMEPETTEQPEQIEKKTEPKKDKLFVYTVRDWKEYLGESLLIIFSVILALGLTEYFTSLHEKENTRTILKSIVAELKHNKTSIQEMHQYNLQVLSKIDSVIADKKLQNDFVSNNELHLKVIAPYGVLYRYLDNNAWTIAKSNNVITKIDMETVALLTKVYNDQEEIMMKLENEVAKVIFDRASRDPKQVGITLILIRDIYHAWAVDRTEGLLQQIDSTIKKVDAY